MPLSTQIPPELLRALTERPREFRAHLISEQARLSGSRSFVAFVKQAWRVVDQAPLVWNWYLDGLAMHLEEIARGRIRRFVGNGPPRNGKSNLFAIMWPAWIWTWAPETKFIYLSYSDDLVTEHSVKCRALIESAWYQDTYRPKWTLGHASRSEQRTSAPWRFAHGNRQDDFVNTMGGRRIASSIGMGVTGRGADIIAIDDPLDANQAGSQAVRDNARRVIVQAISTRFNDPQRGRAALLMQRVAVDDPSKWAIGAGWVHMCTPMEFDEENRSITYHNVDGESRELWRDPRRYDGEPLVPERFPSDILKQIKLDFGTFGYVAQFNQAPISNAMAGLYFQRGWFQFVDECPTEVARRVRRWDLASTEGGGDWTVGVKLSRADNGVFYVEDVMRGQLGPREVRELVKATAALDGQDCPIVIPQDPGQAGKDQAQEYAVMLAGYQVTFPRETGPKVTRAGVASAQAKAGNIRIKKAAWNEAFIRVLEEFCEEADHDDDVDALAGAVTAISIPPKTTFELWGEVDL